MSNIKDLISSLFFVVLFSSVWCFASLLFSRLSGWSELARRFRFEGSFECDRKRFQSCSVGWVNYRGCATVGIKREGLYLALMWIFSFCSPPLLIPWTNMRNVRKKKFLFWEYVLLDVGQPKIATLRFWWGTIKAAAPWLEQNLSQRGVVPVTDIGGQAAWLESAIKPTADALKV